MGAPVPADTAASRAHPTTPSSARPPATTNTVSPPKSPTTTSRSDSRDRRIFTEPPSLGRFAIFGRESRRPAVRSGPVRWIGSASRPPYNHGYPAGHTMSPEDVATFQAPIATEVHRSDRGFWALIATQFQGAYSDNILRNLLLA